MKVRTLRILAAAVGIGCGTAAVTAAEPAKLKLPGDLTTVKAAPADAKSSKTTGKPAQQMDNQKLADAVAAKLADSPAAMTVADLQMFTESGVVTLVGTCQSEADKAAVLKVVSGVGGVTLVKDGLKVGAGKAAPAKPTEAKVRQAQAVAGPMATPMPTGVPPAAGNPDIEPLPLGPAGGMAMGAPPLPNHAWPTYAPYPNMSRVAYPTAYPYNAFPFIGPYYPFPKVPLGWRSVSLNWEDGHWWLGRKQTPQDYWRVKFGY